MSIKDRISEKMVELDLNPTSLSQRAGLNKTYVRDLLANDDPNPRIKHLSSLAEALGVTLSWLHIGDKVEDFWAYKLDRIGKERVKGVLEFEREQTQKRNKSDQ